MTCPFRRSTYSASALINSTGEMPSRCRLSAAGSCGIRRSKLNRPASSPGSCRPVKLPASSRADMTWMVPERSACLKEPTRHHLAGADFGECALALRIEVDPEGLLMSAQDLAIY